MGVKPVMEVSPLLAEERLDYGAHKYSPEVSFEGDKVEVSHELDGGNLVNDLVGQGKALYACEIISPSTAYRKLYLSASGEEKQVLAIPEGEVARDRIYVRPLVICDHQAEYVGAEKHGLHNLLVGKKFAFQKGSIIADGGYHVIERAIGHIFYLREEPEYKEKGTYSLEVEREEGGGFYFRIRMNPDWYTSFMNASDSVKKCFLVSNFATALEYIDRYRKSSEFNSNEQEMYRAYPNLKHLFLEIEEKCCKPGEDIFEMINNDEAARIASRFFPLEILSENED